MFLKQEGRKRVGQFGQFDPKGRRNFSPPPNLPQTGEEPDRRAWERVAIYLDEITIPSPFGEG
jgi:hypothetical protein